MYKPEWCLAGVLFETCSALFRTFWSLAGVSGSLVCRWGGGANIAPDASDGMPVVLGSGSGD